MSVRISRQQWQALLSELDDARRQRHLLTYRALIERLDLPTPAMQTLTAALEHLAALDARAERPLRSALVISQDAAATPSEAPLKRPRRVTQSKKPVRGRRLAP